MARKKKKVEYEEIQYFDDKMIVLFFVELIFILLLVVHLYYSPSPKQDISCYDKYLNAGRIEGATHITCEKLFLDVCSCKIYNGEENITKKERFRWVEKEHGRGNNN